MLDFALQLVSALVYANLGEWLFHRFILHGLGKNPGSIWAFHWRHHAVCIEHDMLDPGYRQISLSNWDPRTKELAVVFAALLLHAPLLWLKPIFGLGVYASIALYYFKHRKAHLQAGWAKRHLPWHYEHHIHPDSGNWCVTWPWCDYLFGTRSKSRDSG